MNVFISEFLRTARLGAFGLGTPAADIVAILGESGKYTEDLPVNIWQFGDLEFNIEDGIIVMIMLVVDASSVALPPQLHVEDMREWAGRPMQEVEDWLTKVGVATTTRSTGESLRWALSSGAALTFMNGAVDSVSVLDRRIGGQLDEAKLEDADLTSANLACATLLRREAHERGARQGGWRLRNRRWRRPVGRRLLGRQARGGVLPACKAR